MDLNALDIPEIQHLIFTKLDFSDLKSCRLVCSTWNQEIIGHNEFNLNVIDSKDGNLDFIRNVNLPKQLNIFELKEKNLKKILNQNLAQVEKLSFNFAYDSKPSLQLHKFSEASNTLSVLEFHRPILASFDMEKECGESIGSNTLFNYLSTLSINHVEDEYEYLDMICDLEQIKLLSKNVCYLLKTIGTRQLERMTLNINADFWDINSCLARNDYRFEDLIMLEFISSQLHLKELALTTPISYPRNDGWSSTVRRSYPTGLRRIDIRNRQGIYALAESQIIDEALFGRNELAYAGLRFDSKYSDFWTELLGSQIKLEKLYFQHEGNFGNANIVEKIFHKNKASLTDFVLETMLTRTIDGSSLHNSKLRTLEISNILFDGLDSSDAAIIPVHLQPGFCKFINVRDIPNTLTSLFFKNVVLDLDEVSQLPQLHLLTSFGLVYEPHHHIRLELSPEFKEIMSTLIHLRHLNQLIVGYIDFEIAQSIRLDAWWNEEINHSTIIIR